MTDLLVGYCLCKGKEKGNGQTDREVPTDIGYTTEIGFTSFRNGTCKGNESKYNGNTDRSGG